MENKYEFQKLTPTVDVNMGIYESAMEYVFSNEDIKNIAVSGAYGAGKSSLIESYKKAHADKKFIHISLAHFSDVESEPLEPEDDEKKIGTLEGKIINQLIHQINPSDIPLTNFRIKKDIDKKLMAKAALAVSLFIAITCFLCFKTTWENMVNRFSIVWLKDILDFTTTTDIELIIGLVALGIMCYAIYKLLMIQQEVRLFKKFNIQGNEIEIFEEAKDSYFDKYLNEVLYIFEHSGVDGIIFEDIDRYNSVLIFEKLREINYLLNQKTKGKKIIRFFYLLRDDIFESKDRTKFFDFLIPIVPIVDASNAYDMFIEYFKNANLLELFDKEFLQELSLYVDDMRVLKNICNEFVIYYNRLNVEFINNNKLLAMIAYKNLFPKDFGELQTGRGYVHTLFCSKDAFKSKKIEKLQLEIEKLREENLQISSEVCAKIDDLNTLYFKIAGRVKVGGKEEAEFATRKDFVKAILENGNVSRYNYNYSYGGSWSNASVDAEIKAMENNEEYKKRKTLIEKKEKGQQEKNNRRIAILEKEIEETQHAYLKDIITRENEKDIFSVNYKNEINETNCFEAVKRSPYFALIKYLIGYGYIDETYPDYMTYFYENSIAAIDKVFLRSITDKKRLPFDYELKNAALVVSRMRIVDFEEPETWNIALLDEILSDTKKYEKQLKHFLHNIWNTEPVEFVALFLRRSDVREVFVREFNKYWVGACNWILSEDGFSLEDKRMYIADTLRVSAEETIDANNFDDIIKEFIENDADFLVVESTDENVIEHNLDMLQIKFKDINFEDANKVLLNYVYEKDMYCINMEMILKILAYFYGITNREEISRRALSLILSKEEQALCAYVKANVNEFIECWILYAGITNDDQDVVIYVLNCGDVSEQNKKLYVERTLTVIDAIIDVEDKQLWGYIFEQNRVKRDNENMCDYYFMSGNGLDNILVEFINRLGEAPSVENIDLEGVYDEEAREKFFLEVIANNKLENERYESLVCSFKLICTNLTAKKINSDKMGILLDSNIIKMNTENLAVMREHYSANCMKYILGNIHEYVSIIDEENFSTDELVQLLEEDISDEIKLELLAYQSEPISIRNKKYSPNIQDYILENLYSKEDFIYLILWYPGNRTKARSLIFDIAVEAIDELTETPCLLHVELFMELIGTNRIELEDKKRILANQIKRGIDKTVVEDVLGILGLVKYQQLLSGKRPKILATISNERLLCSMKERDWISSYEEAKDDPEFFQTYGKMTRRGSE